MPRQPNTHTQENELWLKPHIIYKINLSYIIGLTGQKHDS